MGLFRRRKRDEERALSTTWGEWYGDVQPTWSGANVTTSSSLQLLAVYGSCRIIVESVATLPVDVYRGTSDGAVEVVPPAWITNPIAGLDRAAWVSQVLMSLLLTGNSYCYITRNERGAISELIPIDPSVVSVHREGGRKVVYVNGGPSMFDILHIPAIMLPGADVGLSPVEAARQSIGLGLATVEYAGGFFSRGSTMSGVIEAPADMPPGATEEMAKAWARKHSGKGKSHLPGVLVGGAKWQSTGVTNEQAQFLETRQFTAAEIAGQMFLVDPSELGIPVSGSSLTYANLEQRNARLVRVTLLPWIVRIENALSSLLAQPRYVKFNVNGLLRGDLKTRYESYQVGIDAGFLLRSEARAFEDLPPVDGIDTPPEPPAAPAPEEGGPDA